MAEVSNATRAEWAQHALDEFARHTGQDRDGEPLDEIFSDLLANMMHLADREGLDFEALLRRAQANHWAECIEEGLR